MRQTIRLVVLVILTLLVSIPGAVVAQGIPIPPVKTTEPPYGWVEEHHIVDRFLPNTRAVDVVAPFDTCPGAEGTTWGLAPAVFPFGVVMGGYNFITANQVTGCTLSFVATAQFNQTLDGTFAANVTIICQGAAVFEGLRWTLSTGLDHVEGAFEQVPPTSCFGGLEKDLELRSSKVDFKVKAGDHLFLSLDAEVRAAWTTNPRVSIMTSGGSDPLYLGGLKADVVTKRERRSDEVALEPLETPALGLLSLVALVVLVALARSKRS